MKTQIFAFVIFILFSASNVHSQMYIMNEDFSSSSGTTPPTEWLNVIIEGGTQDEWHFDNPGNQDVDYPIVAPFAIFDAGYYSDNQQLEEVALETPFFDASVSNYVMLEFDHKFISGNGGKAVIQAKEGASWVNIIEFNSDIEFVSHQVVDLSAVIGGVTNSKLRFVWSGNGSGYWAFDNISIYGALPLDAGISNIDNPTPPIGSGVKAIKVQLKNYGYNNINTAEIHWSINNQIQTTYNWNGDLAYGETQSDINIGTYNFQEPSVLKVWSEKPNNQDDSNPYNDTSSVNLISSLCGEYTIGGMNPDFETFTDANNVLHQAGISCAVVFKVRDGEYNEQFEMNDIPGSSEINTITFVSENADSNLVNLHFNSLHNAVVSLNQAKHIRFRRITISGGNSMFIDNFSNDIIIEGCRVIAENDGLKIRSGSENIIVRSNVIESENGIKMNSTDGSVLAKPNDIEILDNEFNTEYSATYFDNVRDVLVKGNNVSGRRMAFYGVSCINVDIEQNRTIISSKSNWTNSIIEYSNSDSLNIVNNYCASAGEYKTYGISLKICEDINVYFNNINITNTDIAEESQGIRLAGSKNINLLNNISSIENKGIPVFIDENVENFNSDYNDFYAPEGKIGQIEEVIYNDLSTWQNVIGGDMHSYNENPFYTSSTDLQPNQVIINNKGITIPGISRDIDDVIRQNPGPDIGAKEFELCNPDAGINYIIEPQNPVSNGVHDIKVVLQNHGTEDLNSVKINWLVNDDLQTPYQWSGNLAGSAHVEVQVGSYEFTGGAYKLKVWTSNPNGQPDCTPVNDTAIVDLASPLCGSYTIGGENPDFEDFTSAANVLNLAGVSCPVNFFVRDGQYNEQLYLRQIPGVSSVNTVSFISVSNDSSKVTIVYNEYPSSALLMKNTKHIRFHKIGFEGYNGAFLDVHSHEIEFANCNFVFDDIGIGFRSGSNDIVVANSNFSGGNHSIYATPNDGIFSEPTFDIYVVNSVLSQSYAAAFIDVSNEVHFTSNEIINSRTGLYFEDSKNIKVSGNKIIITSEYGYYNSAVLLRRCDSSDIFNNYLTTGGDYKSYGIFSNESSNNNFYFNSINITNLDLSRESCGIKFRMSNKDIIKNNIVKVKNTGFPLSIDELSGNYSFDYNDYFSPYKLIGELGDNVFMDLEDWQNAINGDSHSFNENPFYVSDTDLATNQVLLNNKAIPISGINIDIDIKARHLIHPDIGAKEFDPCHPDAGINALTMPVNPFDEGEQEVKVILQNQGNDVLNSAEINWEVNGEPQTSIDWTGSLNSSSSEEIILGTYNFSSGLNYVKVWTSNPNQQIDCNPYNDTIIEKLAVALCGEYTIGGNNPDFENFTDASDVLYLAGVSCPVTFKVRDGVYNEKFAFNEIPGASATNTITFESESGDSSTVLIQREGYNYNIIGFNNASHIRIKKMSVLGTYCVFIDDNSSDIKIESCELSSSEYGIAIRNGSNNIDVNNNKIYGANYGIFISPYDENNNAITPNNIQILNNDFINIYSSVYSEYSNNITVNGNSVNNFRSGFYINNCEGIDINSNRVNVKSESTWYNACIYLDNCNDISLVNNFLSSDGTYKSDGLYSYKSDGLKVYFNSFDIRNTDAGHDSRAVAFSNTDDIIFKNNILNIKYNGNPIYIDGNTTNFYLDYNNYYCPNQLIGQLGNNVFHNLNQWGVAVNGDANSKNVIPYYVSDINPLPYQRELNGAGIPISGILLDINGLIRNDQAPDVGCVEFTVDFGITDLLNPSLDCFHSGSESVTIYLRQFGDIPFIDLKLAYQVNGGAVHNDMVPGTIYNDLVFTFDADIDISSEGEYVFKIWLINTLDDNVNNDTLVVTRYSKPAPEVSAMYDNECSWKEVRFSGTASVSEPYYIDSYEWLFGDGEISNQQNPVHIYDSVGYYDAIFRAYSDAGCYSADTLEVFIDPDYVPLSIDFDLHKEICEGDGDGYLIISGVGGSPPYSYYHNNSELQNTQINNVSTGDYIFRIKDSQQCEFTDTVFVSPAVYLNPQIIPEPDSGYAPLEVFFDLQYNEADSYLWEFDNGQTSTIENPYFLYDEYGEHLVIVTVNSGDPYYCQESDTAIIFVNINVTINAPNVFTPNADGINDYFVVETNGIEDMTTYIYDRQGIKIVELKGVGKAWDGKTKSGKEAPDAVYYYFVDATGFNKLNYHKEGSVTLLRMYAYTNPNPARSVMNVKTYGLNDGNLTYEIYNVNSDLIKSIKAENNDLMSIDVSSLKEGVYILKICDNSSCISKKFIKSNY